jgi:hypothetical protein
MRRSLNRPVTADPLKGTSGRRGPNGCTAVPARRDDSRNRVAARDGGIAIRSAVRRLAGCLPPRALQLRCQTASGGFHALAVQLRRRRREIPVGELSVNVFRRLAYGFGSQSRGSGLPNRSRLQGQGRAAVGGPVPVCLGRAYCFRTAVTASPVSGYRDSKSYKEGSGVPPLRLTGAERIIADRRAWTSTTVLRAI